VPPLIKFVGPIRIDKLTLIAQVRGADLYFHWTIFVVAAFILAGTIHHPILSIVGLLSYLSVILIHEAGHLIAAQRLGCRVDSIELYPIFGLTTFQTPWSRLDHCLIAWSGVLAQVVIAVPLVAWVAVFGYTRIEAINAVFAILGYFSLGVAVVNLLPIPPLDGATAWGLLSALWERRRLR